MKTRTRFLYSGLFLLSLCSLSSCGEKVFTASFWDADNQLLFNARVTEGDTPIYVGKTPTKAPTASKVYAFKGWDPALAPIEADTGYAATFKESPRQYCVTFKDYDGTTLDTQLVDYGGTVTYKGAVPLRDKDPAYIYTFEGWDRPLTNITSDCERFAIYSREIRYYTVSYVDEDNSPLYSTLCAYGSYPRYNGPIPKKADVNSISYVFASWDNDPLYVTGDTLLKAHYEKSSAFDIQLNDFETGMAIDSVKTPFNLPDGNIYIPSRYFCIPVTEINAHLYSYYSTVKDIYFPSTILSLGDDVFSGLSNALLLMEGENIPAGFRSSWNLTVSSDETERIPYVLGFQKKDQSNGLPYAISKVDGKSYSTLLPYRDNDNASLTIPSSFEGDSLTGVCSNAFRTNTTLTTIALPNTLTNFGNHVFDGCTSLAGAILPSGLQELPPYTFNHCALVSSSFSLPGTLKSIGEYALANNHALTSINMPSTLTQIGKYAFQYDTSLASITIPSSITSLEEGAFNYATSLATVSLPKSLKSIAAKVFAGSGIKTIQYGGTFGDWRKIALDANWKDSSASITLICSDCKTNLS